MCAASITCPVLEVARSSLDACLGTNLFREHALVLRLDNTAAAAFEALDVAACVDAVSIASRAGACRMRPRSSLEDFQRCPGPAFASPKADVWPKASSSIHPAAGSDASSVVGPISSTLVVVEQPDHICAK